MLVTNYTDYHIHSKRSPDGRESLEAIGKTAIEKGLSEIAITDHFELFHTVQADRAYTDTYLKQYVDGVTAYQKEMNQSDRLTVRRGIELGQPHENPERMKWVIETGHFDFIIASMHCREDKDCKLWNYREDNLHDLCLYYFEGMYKMVQEADYDVVGHMDYIRRYIWRSGLDVDITQYMSEIDDILKVIIKRNKGIEINGSACHERENATFPIHTVIKRFIELGGKHITFGSDAHQCAHIGRGYETAKTLIEANGIGAFTRYEKRRVIEPTHPMDMLPDYDDELDGNPFPRWG